MFIGYPVWFWITVWHVKLTPEQCKTGIWFVSYINFIFLEIYSFFPTVVAALILFAIIIVCTCYRGGDGGHGEGQGRAHHHGEDDSLLTGLTKYVYDPDQFRSFNECSICMEPFNPDSQITPLPCNIKHYMLECSVSPILLQMSTYCSRKILPKIS